MPKLADHEERRRQITDAARRVVARGGLRAATFQSVAAEARVSVRLVQYYFGTKRDVLLATRHAVIADAGARFERGLAALGEDAAPRAVVRTVLAEVLPSDPRRREDSVVLDAFFIETLTAGAETGADVAPEGPGAASEFLVDVVTAQLHRLRSSPAGAGDRDIIESDARLIVAATTGLAQAMLAAPETVRRADDLLDRLLDRMLVADHAP